MNKTSLAFAIFILAISLMITSCKKDTSDPRNNSKKRRLGGWPNRQHRLWTTIAFARFGRNLGETSCKFRRHKKMLISKMFVL